MAEKLQFARRVQNQSIQKILAAAVSTVVGIGSVQAAINGPYTADSNTLHLWHLNEAAAPAVDSATGAGTFNLLGLLGGATMNAPSASGFGTALNTSAAANSILLGKAALANGTGDNVPFGWANTTNGAFTYEAIVKFTLDPTISATARNMEIISADGDVDLDRNFLFRVENKTATTNARLSFTNLHATGTTGVVAQALTADLPTTGQNAVNTSDFFHVAVSYDGNAGSGGAVKFFFTKLDANTSRASFIGGGAMNTGLLGGGSSDFAVGNEARTNGGETEGFGGLLDEVRISDNARTSAGMMFGGTQNAWNSSTGGTWDTGPWAVSLPNGAGAVANFGTGTPATTADSTIDLAGATKTVGDLKFDNAGFKYTISNGTLALDNGGLSQSLVTVASGNHTIATPVTITAGAVADVAASSTLTVSGPVSNTGTLAVSLAKWGNGTLDLSNNTHTYVGLTSVVAGTLKMDNGTLGVGTTNVEIANGVGTNATISLTNSTLNASRVIIAGSSGNNTFAGNGTLLVSGGTINAGSYFTVGSGYGTITTAASGTAVFSNGAVVNVTRTVDAAANLEVGNFTATKGVLTINDAATKLNMYTNSNINIGANAGAGGGTVNHNGGAVTFYSDAGTTAGGTGVLRIGNTASGTGVFAYNLNGGTLTANVVTRTTSPTSTGYLNFNGGTLKAAGANGGTFINNLTAANVQAGGAKIDSNGFSVAASQALIHDPALGATLDGGLTKSGAGTLTLNGANTYTGPTNVSQGVLAINTLHAAPGALNVASGAGLQISRSTAAGSINVSSFAPDTAALTFALGAFGNPTNAQVNVTGANGLTLIGNSTVNISGGSLSIGSFALVGYSGTRGAGTLTVGTLPPRIVANIVDVPGVSLNLNITSYDSIKWTGLNGGLWDINVTQAWKEVVSGNATNYLQPVVPGDAVLFDDTATNLGVSLGIAVSPAAVTFNNNVTNTYTITGAGSITGSTGLTKNGAGTAILSNDGINNFSGAIVVNNGTLQVGTGTASGNIGGGSVTINSGGYLSYNRNAFLNLTNTYLGTGTLVSANPTGSGLGLGASMAGFDGTILAVSGVTDLNGATALGTTVGGTIVKNGGEIRIFNSAPTFGDALTIEGAGVDGGAVRVGGNQAATFSSSVTLTGATTLLADGGATLILAGPVSGSNVDLTGNGSGAVNITGTLNLGTGNIAHTGSGVITIANVATYNGITINGGVVQIGNGGTLGNMGTGSVNAAGGNLAINHSDAVNVTNQITGSFGVINNGAGTTTLSSNASDFFGSVTANNGTLILAGASNATSGVASGDGALALPNPAALAFMAVGTVNSNNAQLGGIELSGNGTNLFANGVYLAGRNNGVGSIRSVAGNNSIIGPVSFAAVGGGEAVVSVSSGSTLDLKGDLTCALTGLRQFRLTGTGVGTVSGNVFDGAGTVGLTKTGTGTWTVNGSVNATGVTTVNGGNLVLSTNSQSAALSAASGSDIQNGTLVLQHAADGGAFRDARVAELATGYAGNFIGTVPFKSSTAVAAVRGLGWKDDGTNMSITAALYGDTNFDGKVNTIDFNDLAGNFGTSSKEWVKGNFNYDTGVNSLDFNMLVATYGMTIPMGSDLPLGTTSAGSVAGLGSVVPEPASLSLLALGATALMGRRRKF